MLKRLEIYEISVSASKQGYKIINKKEQFSVIEKSVDVKGFKLPSVSNKRNYLWIILVGLIVLLIVFYLIIKFSKKRK